MNDQLTSELARQVLGERVPGFVSVLAKAFGIPAAELYQRIESGSVTKTEALAVLAKLAINLQHTPH